MTRHRCTVCDHHYDPAEGDPDSGVAPGTPEPPGNWPAPTRAPADFVAD
nr:rubredoxin [Deltaproteobacteria bacterium]